MPGPVITRTSLFPEWTKPENASVFDPAYRAPIRTLISLLGLDDPQQVMMLGTPLETPGETGGLIGEVAKRFPRLVNAIKAYHGSPYDFEKFSTERIGTGEGAQAYGHGLYFAESEGTARAYRENFEAFKDAAVQTSSGERLNVPTWVQRRMDAGQVDSVIDDFSGRLKEMRDVRAAHSQPWLVDDQIQGAERILKAAHAFKAGQAKTIPAAHMYEVGIHADPEHFIDWDKPLTEQTPQVQAAAQRAGIQPGDLNDWHNDLRSGGDRALAAQGLPGIKYLDQGSRLTKGGTRNFVVFDDALIEVMRKYGWVLPVAGAGSQAIPAPQQK